jgi:dipeptidase E
MQKILLLSSGLAAIKDFVGKDPASLRILFVPTAGNTYDNVWWIDKDRAVLKDYGFQITELDIAHKTTEELSKALTGIDIVYISGGNTFYLLEQLRTTGFDTLVIDFINNGGMYAGASAGAIIVGPDIEIARDFDDLDHAFNLPNTEGFRLIDFIPFPHYDMKGRTEIIDALITDYSEKYKVTPFTDDQAILINGDEAKLISSPRSETELNWLRQ